MFRLFEMDLAHREVIGLVKGGLPLEEEINLSVVVLEDPGMPAFACVPGPFGPMGE